MNAPSPETQPSQTPPAQASSTQAGVTQIFVDLGPILVFMLTYALAPRFGVPEGEAIFVATSVFIPATFAALGYAWFRQKRLPPMLLVTAVIVGVFGGLTLVLHNELFIYLKPTIINLLFAGAIFGGLAFGQNVWKMLFQSAFTLPDNIWKVFAIRWGLFYIFLAALNEIIWRNVEAGNLDQSFWVNFKLLGVMPLTLLFMAANVPLLLKHMPKERSDSSAQS